LTVTEQAAIKTNMTASYGRLAQLAALSVLLWPPLASAQQALPDDSDSLTLARTLSVGIAAGIMRFDTNFKFTDRDTGRSVFLDAEGTMELPDVKAIPLIYGYWRPSQKHGLGFGYFSIRRESELVAIDRNFGDLSLEGRATLTDDTRFYAVTYNYTVFQDARALLFASFGIKAIDLEYQFDAAGIVSLDGEPVESGTYSETLEQFAPIPLVGIDAWFALTDKWSFGARAAFVAGDISDVRAVIVESSIRAKYHINQKVGLFIGINHFDGDITINDTDQKTEINYGLDGLLLGIDIGF
jgi:hypothetical protein